MKISNETKVGALTAIAITMLILGYNFLKGRSLTDNSIKYYATFKDIRGLDVSNPVVINGKQVGAVAKTDGGKDLRQIVVTMHMNIDVHIPTNSIAIINKSLLGSVQLEINLGSDSTFVPKGGTIRTEGTSDILDDAMQKLDPVLYQVKNAVKALDSVLMAVNGVLDPVTKTNIKSVVANLDKTTGSLSRSAGSLEVFLDPKSGSLAKSLDHINSFTGNLEGNNGKLNNVITNLDKTATNLSKLDIEKTLNLLNNTIGDLKGAIAKLNTNSGTAGLLLNDTRLYNNLTATANKLNLLIDDLKTNPKRYVNISVFGKKDKGKGLSVPLPDTVNAPYKR